MFLFSFNTITWNLQTANPKSEIKNTNDEYFVKLINISLE